MANTWFRLYSEVVDDPKLRRVARILSLPKATALGMWCSLLCLANESPERGQLLLAPGVPLSRQEISEAMGIDADTLGQVLGLFEELGMVVWENDTLAISHWSERQFESDNSTERVRRYRKRQAVEETPEPDGDETLRKRFSNVSCNGSCNGPESESESDTESESESDTDSPAGAGAPGGAPSTFPDWQARIRDASSRERAGLILEFFRQQLPRNEVPEAAYIAKTAKAVGGYGRLLDLLWQQVPRPPTGDVLAYVRAVHEGRGNGRASPRDSPRTYDHPVADNPTGERLEV